VAEGTKAAEESSLSADAFVSTARTAIRQFYPNEIHFSSSFKINGVWTAFLAKPFSAFKD
jgi:hypothetical protein